MREKTLDGQSLGASFTSRWIDISLVLGWSVSLIWTGTPDGTFQIQASNTGTDDDAEDISGASVVTGGIAGKKLMNLAASKNYKYIRIKYTRTASTGSVDAYASGLDHK